MPLTHHIPQSSSSLGSQELESPPVSSFSCSWLLISPRYWRYGLLISWDSRLHSPMYYLLCGLSVIDRDVHSHSAPVVGPYYPATPAVHLLVQFFFFYALEVTDFLICLLWFWIATWLICDPLHCHSVMNYQLCAPFLALSWLVSIVHTRLHVGLPGMLRAMLTFPAFFVMIDLICEPLALTYIPMSWPYSWRVSFSD